MNIDQMAHDFAMKLVGNPTTPLKDINSIVCASWSYVDAMQAESDKRKPKGLPEVLFEPDWSQAPESAKWWAMDENGSAAWYEVMPYIDVDEFNYEFGLGVATHVKAPSFNYQGDWKDSLRKRP